MNIDVLTNGGIDYKLGLEYFLNDEELYQTILEIFSKDDIIKNTRKAYERNDMEDLAFTVHKAKGTSGNAHIQKAYDAASNLVSLLKKNEYTKKEVDECYTIFEKEYLLAQETIRNALK